MNNNHCVSITVYMNQDSVKPVLLRELYLHGDIDVPYNRIVSVMRFLYGSQCVVCFKSQFLANM